MTAPGDKGSPKGPPRPPGTVVRGSGAFAGKSAAATGSAATLTPTDITEIEIAPGELMELDAGSMVGEYRIDGRLGEGGMATVYAATHPLIGKRAAIKVMSPQLSADTAAVERFVQEARAVNQIGHPNIIDVFAFGTLPDGRSYFVMELLPGETLHARMKKEPLKLRDSIAILFDVCDALEAAHEKDIVHRDLKPDNIFLVSLRNNKRQVKLLDFGVAKLSKASDARMERTRQDTIIGTPHYLSPEQARAKGVDARTDVYSLGVMAFEMIVGKVPFDADNVMEVMVQHMTQPPPVPSSLRPGIPARLDEIVVRMLAKEPDKRPTIDEIRGALGEIRDLLAAGHDGMGPSDDRGRAALGPLTRATPAVTTSSPDVASEPIPELTSTSGRSRLPIFLGLGAVILVGGGFFLFGGSNPPPKPTAPVAPPTPAPVVAAPKPEPPAPAPAPIKSTLRIKVDAPDATIEVDENVIAEHASSAQVSLGFVGTHVVKASAPGRKSVTKVLTVVEGETVDLPLSLPKVAAGKPKSAAPTGSGKKNSEYMLDPFGKH